MSSVTDGALLATTVAISKNHNDQIVESPIHHGLLSNLLAVISLNLGTVQMLGNVNNFPQGSIF